MVNRSIWLLIGLVCAVHFFLLKVFLHSDGAASPSDRKRTQFSLAVIERLPATAVPFKKIELPKPQPLAPPVGFKIASPPQVHQTAELAVSPQQPIQGYGVNLALDRSRFLDLNAIDQSAISTGEFEPTLAKVLPANFESMLLELLIDETGRTVQVACIEGDCFATTDDGLQQLLDVPFLPAIKNGKTVASRKVIEVFPTPTFGL